MKVRSGFVSNSSSSSFVVMALHDSNFMEFAEFLLGETADCITALSGCEAADLIDFLLPANVKVHVDVGNEDGDERIPWELGHEIRKELPDVDSVYEFTNNDQFSLIRGVSYDG